MDILKNKFHSSINSHLEDKETYNFPDVIKELSISEEFESVKSLTNALVASSGPMLVGGADPSLIWGLVILL